MLSVLQIIKFLLDNGANINAKDKYNTSVLMYALRSPIYGVVKLLLDNGANVNFKNRNKDTALMRACKNTNNINIIQLILDRGGIVNINNRSRFGRETALMYACKCIKHKNNKIIKLLLYNNADINICNINKETALTYIKQYEIYNHRLPIERKAEA